MEKYRVDVVCGSQKLFVRVSHELVPESNKLLSSTKKTIQHCTDIGNVLCTFEYFNIFKTKYFGT